MRNEENNLLAKWLEGSINQSETESLSSDIDMETLIANLEKLSKLKLNSKPIDKSWDSLLKRIKRPDLVTSSTQDHPVTMPDSFSYSIV
jgi:hypothetical protein